MFFPTFIHFENVIQANINRCFLILNLLYFATYFDLFVFHFNSFWY